MIKRMEKIVTKLSAIFGIIESGYVSNEKKLVYDSFISHRYSHIILESVIDNKWPTYIL
jgi:hypothetical protein